MRIYFQLFQDQGGALLAGPCRIKKNMLELVDLVPPDFAGVGDVLPFDIIEKNDQDRLVEHTHIVSSYATNGFQYRP